MNKKILISVIFIFFSLLVSAKDDPALIYLGGGSSIGDGVVTNFSNDDISSDLIGDNQELENTVMARLGFEIIPFDHWSVFGELEYFNAKNEEKLVDCLVRSKDQSPDIDPATNTREYDYFTGDCNASYNVTNTNFTLGIRYYFFNYNKSPFNAYLSIGGSAYSVEVGEKYQVFDSRYPESDYTTYQADSNRPKVETGISGKFGLGITLVKYIALQVDYHSKFGDEKTTGEYSYFTASVVLKMPAVLVLLALANSR